MKATFEGEPKEIAALFLELTAPNKQLIGSQEFNNAVLKIAKFEDDRRARSQVATNWQPTTIKPESVEESREKVTHEDGDKSNDFVKTADIAKMIKRTIADHLDRVERVTKAAE